MFKSLELSVYTSLRSSIAECYGTRQIDQAKSAHQVAEITQTDYSAGDILALTMPATGLEQLWRAAPSVLMTVDQGAVVSC